MRATERKRVRAMVIRELEVLRRDWFDFTAPKETQPARVSYARELLTMAIEAVRRSKR